MAIEPFDLLGPTVHLTAMTIDDVGDLVTAATQDRGTYGYTAVPADRVSMDAYVQELVAGHDRGKDVPFVTRDAATGRALGSTPVSYTHLTLPTKRIV